MAAEVALPTYAAERLAAEFLETDGDAPTGRRPSRRPAS